MRRRDLIAMIGGAAIAWPSSTDAQQSAKVPLVGILSDESRSPGAKSFQAFAQGVQDLGYVEGQNIAFERRYAEGKNEILPSLAAELVGLEPDVILAIGTPATRAAKTATQTIPIVFVRIGDPIGLGLVRSLAHPGGNLTGVTILTNDLEAKRVELLITAVPEAKRLGILWDSSFPPARAELKETEGAARSLNLEPVLADVRGPDEFEPALVAMVEQRAGALIVIPGLIFTKHIRTLTDLLAKARLPAMFYRREQVDAGGLMSYGTNYPATYRRAAAHVDKILKGATPADIPVEPTKLELVINLKTARALGLTVPPILLARVDEVIE
jgi:putative ABC transport system substrate-binding protein